MTTAVTATAKAAWQAEMAWARRYYTTEEPAPPASIDESADGATTHPEPAGTVEVLHSVIQCFVRVSRPGCDTVNFLVNHREGRGITFTDPRGRDMGTAGVAGIWGTRPAPPTYKPRPLLPSAFRVELARLVGAERASEIVRTVLDSEFFQAPAEGAERSGVRQTRLARSSRAAAHSAGRRP